MIQAARAASTADRVTRLSAAIPEPFDLLVLYSRHRHSVGRSDATEGGLQPARNRSVISESIAEVSGIPFRTNRNPSTGVSCFPDPQGELESPRRSRPHDRPATRLTRSRAVHSLRNFRSHTDRASRRPGHLHRGMHSCAYLCLSRCRRARPSRCADPAVTEIRL